MPARDGRGPYGEGPRTGKRLGKCETKGNKTDPQMMQGLMASDSNRRHIWNDAFGRLFRLRRRDRIH